MAEKLKNKTFIIIIVAAIVVVLILGIAIFKVVSSKNSWKKATNADDISISEKDSNEVKAEKLQKKIELINEEIEKMQVKLNPELEKLNALYEEYVNVMNDNQPVATEAPTEEPTEEETTAPETTEEQTEEATQESE